MSDMRQQLADMADGLFTDLAGADFAAAWPRLAEAGFAGLLVSEADGGFGGDWGDFYAVLRLAGLHALSAPLGETILAHKLLADAGIERPDGAIGLAVDGARVAFGRDCAAVLVADGPALTLYPAEACVWEEGRSPQDEPRDRLSVAGAPLASFTSNADPLALGAFIRLAQSAGALDAAFALAIEHVNARVQFGKPLAKFQAVQQALATASEHIAAVACAGQAAAVALDLEEGAGDADFEIAAAKLRTNIAIEAAVPILHRVHGAIGYTMEYPLNRYTRRLMGWRGEFGNDALWSQRLGARVAALGGAGLWLEVTARGDRVG